MKHDIQRYTAGERSNHWVVAILFVLAGLDAHCLDAHFAISVESQSRSPVFVINTGVEKRVETRSARPPRPRVASITPS